MRSFPIEFLDDPARVDPGEFTARYRAGDWYENGSEPNRFFMSRWYALHNADWAMCASPFDHYLTVGLRERRDPSPFVDFATLTTKTSRRNLKQDYAALVRSGAGPSHGVYQSTAELRSIQDRFLDRLTPSIITAPAKKRRNLVFLQHRQSPRIAAWTALNGRSFDVLANHFDASDIPSSRSADGRVVQPGTKFTAISRLLSTRPDMLTGYEYVMLLDDDLAITAAQIETAFSESLRLDASLAQPALSDDSECAWPHLFASHRPGKAIEVNTVEVMMPIFSAEFFTRAAPHFSTSVSGFGLDMLWGSLLRRPHERALRIGSVVVKHERPVDRTGGAYYQFLRNHLINPRAELWSLVVEHDLQRSIHEH